MYIIPNWIRRAVSAMVQKILLAAAAAVNRYENILINPLFMCCSPCRTSSDRGCSTRWSANCPYENTPLARYVVTTGSVLSLCGAGQHASICNKFIYHCALPPTISPGDPVDRYTVVITHVLKGYLNCVILAKNCTIAPITGNLLGMVQRRGI